MDSDLTTGCLFVLQTPEAARDDSTQRLCINGHCGGVMSTNTSNVTDVIVSLLNIDSFQLRNLKHEQM